MAGIRSVGAQRFLYGRRERLTPTGRPFWETPQGASLFLQKGVCRESFDILRPFKTFAISRSFSQLFAVSPQLFAIFRSFPQFSECVWSVHGFRTEDDETMKKKRQLTPGARASHLSAYWLRQPSFVPRKSTATSKPPTRR